MPDEDQDVRRKLEAALDQVMKEGCGEKGIGALPMRDMFFDYAQRSLNTAQNTQTIMKHVEEWVEHFKENLKKMPKDAHWASMFDRPVRVSKGNGSDAAVVVGNGPVLPEDFGALAHFDGYIIAGNKSLTTLLEHGIEPDIITVLHTTDEILPHFQTDAIKKHRKLLSSWCLTTTLHPKVVDAIRDISTFPEEREYWVNAAIPEEQVENLNQFMSMLSGLPFIDTGGNVGIFGMVCAYEFGLSQIGLMGMGHALEPNPKWTREQSLGYIFEYDPKIDKIYAIPPTFQTYVDGMARRARVFQSEGVRVVNLTPYGSLYIREGDPLPYMTVAEFVKETMA